MHDMVSWCDRVMVIEIRIMACNWALFVVDKNWINFVSRPMLRGRVPLISLYEISNSSKANNLPKESGNGPEMELEGRFITSKDDSLPIESGIGPEIELDPSSRVCKDDKFPKVSGINPEIEFP
ncbi:hypothetical protein E3N88_12900 [Mikania micrantha]|uniref:Uncharacterized protein n=1 Tax=Mikania micrantha TaxID=192012 RepID=A0A5N6P6W3_9ASTR|nr:hypothetical protein E3N88_12900 [Mikania micrantha]